MVLVIWALKGLKKSINFIIQIQAIIELSVLAKDKNKAPNLFKHPCQSSCKDAIKSVALLSKSHLASSNSVGLPESVVGRVER